MPEPENPARRSLYDREVEFQHDETHPGRRHRQIPDWGGDELFARMPRRRSIHDGGQRSRRFGPADAEAADRSGRFALADADAPDRSRRFAASGADEPASSRGKRRRAADDWGLELLSDPPSSTAGDAPEQRRPDGGTSDRGPEPQDADPGWVLGLGADERDGDAGVRAVGPRSAPVSPGGADPGHLSVRGGAAGPRTLVIGRSGSRTPGAPFAPASRRRPPRTVAERIGGRPERMVAWAFALGLILILIAIATAHV